jgi:hypothetical protein
MKPLQETLTTTTITIFTILVALFPVKSHVLYALNFKESTNIKLSHHHHPHSLMRLTQDTVWRRD